MCVVSVCVCVCACVCLAAFACTHLCMSERLSNFYGDCLVKRTVALGPALLGTGSPTGSPGATTYKESQADAHLLDDHFKNACPDGLLRELQPWLRPDWPVTTLSQAHVHKQRHTLKITIRP